MSTLLSIKRRAEDIKKMYDEDPRTKTFNCLVYGSLKTGKTSLLRTCPKPVFVHSFDPSGTLVLRDMIEKGEVLADTRFENEDPFKPTACQEWEDSFNTLYRKGFFDHVGTFALDSMTTWASIIMNEVIRRAAKAKKNREIGGAPQQQDWLLQMSFIENYIRKFLSLPCHCILLGHADQARNEEGAAVGDLGIMITGKLKEKIYYLRIKDFKTGSRELLTQPLYGIQAGSRLGYKGLLGKTEPPDIRKIMDKVGIDSSDKPLFKDLKEEEEVTEGG